LPRRLPHIFVDLGRARKRLLRALRNGRGPLMIEVEQVVHQVQTGFGSDDVDKRIVPIVIIYKLKKSQWE
jgi:hypothetical protein